MFGNNYLTPHTALDVPPQSEKQNRKDKTVFKQWNYNPEGKKTQENL